MTTQRIDARSDETEGLGPQGESLVGAADAPETSSTASTLDADRERIAAAVREACDYAVALRLGTRELIVDRATDAICLASPNASRCGDEDTITDALECAKYLDGYSDIVAKAMYGGERPSGIWQLERAARLLRALSQPNASNGVSEGWRDISTAPKDGSVIDVWRDEMRETVYWGFPPHECGEMGRYCDSDWHSLKEPGWICSTFGEFVGEKHDPFTHWRPYPDGPLAKSTDQKAGS